MKTLVAAAALVLVAAACGDAGDLLPEVDPATAPTADLSGTTQPPPPPTTVPPATVPATTVPITTGDSPATTAPPTTVPPASQPATWAQVATTGEAPPPRRNAVLVYDGQEDAAYLHGGRTGGESLADLWRLDLGTGQWTELTPGGGPEPRFSHTAIWDGQRRRVVVFSGEGAGFGDFFSDVWAYDPAADAWEELAPDGAGPADRYGSCAGYDPAGDRFLITHGFTDSGRFDDTWQFDLATNTWTEVTPGGELPGARCLHACGYDETTGSLVMFGGQDDDVAFLDDTWVLGAGGWSQAPAGPSARKFPGLAPVGGGIAVFGGDSAEGDADDTWHFAGGQWTELAPEGRPSPRESVAAAHEATGAFMLVFGGSGPDGELNDVWRFTPGT